MKQVAVFFLLLLSKSMLAQYVRSEQGIKSRTQSMDIEVKFYSPKIVRVLKAPMGIAVRKESLSVIKSPEKTAIQVASKGDVVSVKSNAIEVRLNVKTGKLSFYNLVGDVLLTEKDYGAQFTPFVEVNNNTHIVRQAFLLDKDEVIYGLGQQQTGKMNQRGQKLLLRQSNMKICIPFIQSAKGYGLFWDNYSPTTFLDNIQETSFESESGDCADYYFMYGGNADGVVAQMRSLTGQSPMLPLWSFGFCQSRERYTSQEQTLGVVKEYRRLGVPLDGIIQDWQYWGSDSNWNAMRFDNPAFSNAQSMIDSIHQLNAHLTISVWPSFGPHTKQYEEFKAKKMLLNFTTWPSLAKVYDPYHPEARDIYWKYLNSGLFSLGTDAWWMDATEPEHDKIKEADFDNPTYLGTFRHVRNAFPLMTVGGVYDNQRKTTSDKRVFILTRSAFAGQQRYGATTWSGDIHSKWDVLRKQIPAGLNLALCGIPYWNTDIGGFVSIDYNGGNKNKNYQELYTRWMQFGTFCSMMRSHGTNTTREIYQFGKKGDWCYDAQEKYINLRYSLLPYIYATSWDITKNAGSFMRALFTDFNADKNVHNIDNEFLFGKSILVAPVTESMYINNNTEDFSKVKAQPVYLPKGANWYDFWTNEFLSGGQTVNKETPIDIIPLYIKAGTILPWGPKVQFATEKIWDDLEIRIYTGADGVFTLYEDENDNYNYEKGLYTTIPMKWKEQTHTLTIEDRHGSFAGMMVKRRFNIVLIDRDKKDVGKVHKAVEYSGKQLSIKLF